MAKELRFVFWANDYEKTVDFYRNQLKFPIVQEWDRGPAQRGTVFHMGSANVEILAVTPDKVAIHPEGFELYTEVEEVNAFYEYVKSKGIAIRGEIADKPWGQRTFSISDPNGIKLVFFTNL